MLGEFGSEPSPASDLGVIRYGKKYMHFYTSFIFILTLLLPASYAIGNPWFEGTDFDIQISSDKNQPIMKYNFKIYKKGDIKIQHRSDDSPNGTMLLLSGKYLLVKDINLPYGKETDIMDYGGLMFQLVARILGKVIPEGNRAISEKKRIIFSEEHDSIKVTTTSSSGRYLAPWRAIVEVVPNDGIITYNINFKYSNEHSLNNEIELDGYWSNPEKLTFSDEYPLNKFKLYKLGPIITSNSAHYGATIQTKSFVNVGEFRKYVQKLKP